MNVEIHGDVEPYRFEYVVLEDSFVEEGGRVTQFEVQIRKLNQLLYGDEEIEVSLKYEDERRQAAN